MAYKQISPQEVIEGGTGASSFTAYAPICGGSTSTSSFQSSATGLSTTGYLYTSNGSSSLPSFQEAPSSERFTLGTPVATTSGTTASITGIPSGVKYVAFMMSDVNASGTGNWALNLGTASGLETSGYEGRISNASGGTTQDWSTNIRIDPNSSNNSSKTYICKLVMGLIDTSINLWAMSINQYQNSSGTTSYGSGIKALSGELTQMQLSISSGGMTAGEINILYSN